MGKGGGPQCFRSGTGHIRKKRGKGFKVSLREKGKKLDALQRNMEHPKKKHQKKKKTFPRWKKRTTRMYSEEKPKEGERFRRSWGDSLRHRKRKEIG